MSHRLALRPGEVVRVRGERWIVVRQLAYEAAQILEVDGYDTGNRSVSARFVLPFEAVDCLPASRAPRVVRPAEWRRVARGVLARGLSSDGILRTIAAANARVFPFQLEPALAVLRGLGSRVLLADDVGLGKTVQAGLIAAELLARTTDAHVLIVVPAGLRNQWQAELKLRLGIDPAPIDSATLANYAAGTAAGSNPWRAAPVVMASIDYIKRPEVLRSLEGLIWDAVIFDEAHALSGRSDRAAAAGALAERARVVAMVSATPHSGDDIAFNRLCGLGDLAGGFPLVIFRRMRQDVGLSSLRRTTWLRVRRTTAEAGLHLALMEYARRVWRRPGANASGAQLAMTVLVRRACSSAASLARSVERRLAMLESENQAGPPFEMKQPFLPWGDVGDDEEPTTLLMAAGLDDAGEEQRRLGEILQLARAASVAESKLRAIVRLLRRSREPVIVFTEYRDTLVHIAHNLRGLSFVTLHGGLTATERAESVERFNAGDARVLIATDAASEGLNLQQRCRVVVNLELPWTPLRLEQRVGRVDRLGQRRRVHAVHLIGDGTSDESTVARLLERFARIEVSAGELRRSAFDEKDVARSVIGRETLTGSEARSDKPTPHVIVPRLDPIATIEADRATTARRLGGAGFEPASQLRPMVTLLRRRQRLSRCYWAFRLRFEEADSWGRWDLLIGVEHRGVHSLLRTGNGVRDAVRRCMSEAERAAERRQPDILRALRAQLLPFLTLAIRREIAIMGDIRERHARLAARVRQPGLFDRRAERAATAQSAMVDDALTYGATRLRSLERGATMAVASSELVFAAIVE